MTIPCKHTRTLFTSPLVTVAPGEKENPLRQSLCE